MISYPIYIFLFLLSLISTAHGAEIAVLKSQDLPIYQQALDGFQDVYEGKITEYNLQGNPQEAEKIILSIKKQKPDVVLAIGLLAARAAKEYIEDTPIIFCMVLSPERYSLRGRYITGVKIETSPSLVFSRIREIFPQRKRIGVLYDPDKTGELVTQARRAADRNGLTLVREAVRSRKNLPPSARTLLPRVDLLWLTPDSTILSPESLDFLLLASFENNLPIVTFSDDLVKRGAVVAFSPDYTEIGRQAAILTLRVLGGERPDRLPIRSVERLRLSINQKTAKKMGIVISPKILQSAEVVYE